MFNLGSLGGTESNGGAINASGQISGSSLTNGDAAYHAFLWKPTITNGTSGTMHDLGTLGGTESFGGAINTSGQVAGFPTRLETRPIARICGRQRRPMAPAARCWT
jgi:probable HAF family extracellular repeat protein